MSDLAPETDWLRADATADAAVRVDRGLGVIYGRVLAEKGPFKSQGRGEFDDRSLDAIVELAKQKPAGLKSRFTHPGLSADGLGKFLGRDRNVRRDGDKVRGDLHLDRTALDTPPSGGKPLGVYVMDLAESDPGAFGSSLVLKADKEYRLEKDGTPTKDDKGGPLPPLWRPTKLHAIDVVDDGDAVHGGFLSADALPDLPDAVVREARALLLKQFPGDTPPPVVRARCLGWLDSVLRLDYDAEDEPMSGKETDAKPPADPKPPKPAPTPAPTPPTPAPGAPNPTPAKPRAELSADDLDRLAGLLDEVKTLRSDLAAVKADHAAVKADATALRQEQDQAAKLATERRIAAAVGDALTKGKIAPRDKDRKLKLLAALDWQKPVGTLSQDGKDVPATALDLALDDLARTPAEQFRERLRAGAADPGVVPPERKRELLALGAGGSETLSYVEKHAPHLLN